MKRFSGSRWLLGILASLVLVVFLFGSRAVQIYVDVLWFDSLGYMRVFWTMFWYKLGLFVLFFGLTFLLLRGAFAALHRAFRDYVLGGTVKRFDDQTIDLSPERFMPALTWGVTFLWSLVYGMAMSVRWEMFIFYFNGSRTGIPDPIFGKPLGFFLFAWPMQQMLASWLFSIAVIILAAALIYLVLVFISRMPAIIGREARLLAYKTSSLALAFLLAVHAWRVYLGRYALLWNDHDLFTGVGYTQANVTLPGLLILALALLAGAVIAVLNAMLWRRPRILIAALSVPVVFGFGLGVVGNYVSNFVVKPNELARESAYIKHNIDWTRRAFSLDKMAVRSFPARSDTASFTTKPNAATLDNIRLWDWEALQATLRQVQVLRTYYDFPDVDVDRYRINGRMRQVMIAARELDINRLPPNSRNWVNDRLTYTHGYGVTMNLANGFTSAGRPRLVMSDMPVRSTEPDIKLTRPQIYFGQLTNTPVYVKTKQPEFDYPQGDKNAYTTYEGTGGIELGGFLRRTLLAWSLGDLSKIPFSSDITPQSRVLMYRNIRERVARIAPFLSYDNDPYIVIGNDGRLYWMMDAYTSSAYYPYSRHYVSQGRWTNYIRNSVKVVVDAYNGSVDFYIADAQDPLIQTYARTFPGLFRDLKEMPADLRAHLRYPESLFRTQAEAYGLYHIRDVNTFFGQQEVWNVAEQALSEDAEDAAMARRNGGPINPALVPLMRVPTQPLDPYFVLMRLPGEKQEDEFVQILPFTSGQKTMTGWMAGRSDGENYGRLLAFDFPKSVQVNGPAQVRARINQEPFLSGQFTLWGQQGSSVLRGNMLVIPLGESLLYIEPIFLQAKQSSTPELRLVVLATQERLVYGTTFQEALTKLVGSGAAASIAEPDENVTDNAPEAAPPGTTPGSAKPAPVSGVPVTAAQQQLINKAARDLEEYQRLTAAGRYSEAGQRLESLRSSLNRLKRP